MKGSAPQCVAFGIPAFLSGSEMGSSFEFQCYECGASFVTKQAWSLHRQQAHGASSAFDVAKRFAIGSVCQCCLMECHSRLRLTKHLAHTRRSCLESYMAYGLSLTAEEQEIADPFIWNKFVAEPDEFDNVPAVIPKFMFYLQARLKPVVDYCKELRDK